MKKISFVILLVIVGSGLSSCDLLTVNTDVGEYPSTFHPLETEELEAMNDEYQQANGNHICSTLNEYGLTGFSEVFFQNGVNPCTNREVVRVEMTNIDTLESAAKASLLKNSVYTGVEDTSGLVLKEMNPLPGCTICEGPNENRVDIEWRLVFQNQTIDSVEVLDTEITVFIDAEGVNRIWGNWYSGIKDPEFIKFGFEEVKEGMEGWKVDMRQYTGSENIYTITEEDLEKAPRKVFLPVVEDEKLKIRACWAIPISYNGEDEFTGWTAYIDIEEGFLVKFDAL